MCVASYMWHTVGLVSSYCRTYTYNIGLSSLLDHLKCCRDHFNEYWLLDFHFLSVLNSWTRLPAVIGPTCPQCCLLYQHLTSLKIHHTWSKPTNWCHSPQVGFVPVQPLNAWTGTQYLFPLTAICRVTGVIIMRTLKSIWEGRHAKYEVLSSRFIISSGKLY